jgi:putative hydrolase of the HAD superfamily
MKPKGVLIDCGGTLLDEITYDLRAGDEWMLKNALPNSGCIALDTLSERRSFIEKEVVARRDQCRLETPWTVITRLIYDQFGMQFELDWRDLELGFWRASMSTRAMPGAKEALAELWRHGIPVGVLSNSIYRPSVLLYELKKQELAEHLKFVMSSAEHGVRKPDPLIFKLAATKLQVPPTDIWFVGDKLEIDVHGSQSAGMTPVWFQPQAASPMPCTGVADWRELLHLYHES